MKDRVVNMANSSSGTCNTYKSVVMGYPDVLICEGIAGILLKAHYRVLGKTSMGASLKKLALEHKPDIILFEPLICECYVDIIRTLRQEVPEAVIVLIIKRGIFDSIMQAIEAGASGCISVDVSPEEFIKSLELLSMGDVVVSKDMANNIRREITAGQKLKPIGMLSYREREVLGHIGNGLNNRQIARNLFISEHTVKVHVRGILNKLDLKNRQQAAVYAAKEGLIPYPTPENNGQSAS